jgi:hypothetical protein
LRKLLGGGHGQVNFWVKIAQRAESCALPGTCSRLVPQRGLISGLTRCSKKERHVELVEASLPH